MAKGPTRKPKADSVEKSSGSPQPDPAPTKGEPSEMYKLFTKGRRFDLR